LFVGLSVVMALPSMLFYGARDLRRSSKRMDPHQLQGRSPSGPGDPQFQSRDLSGRGAELTQHSVSMTATPHAPNSPRQQTHPQLKGRPGFGTLGH
jgi:hypothetical protein